MTARWSELYHVSTSAAWSWTASTKRRVSGNEFEAASRSIHGYWGQPERLFRARLHTGNQGETDQLGKAARPSLVHESRAVNLDGARANLQIVSNRFVGPPREETFQHLKLMSREQRELRGCLRFRWILARRIQPRQCRLQVAQNCFRGERLFD